LTTATSNFIRYQGVADIWCTDREFLDLRAGDWEEHAILLANYCKVSGLL